MSDETNIAKLIENIKSDYGDIESWLVLGDCLQEQGGKRKLHGEIINLFFMDHKLPHDDLLEKLMNLYGYLNVGGNSPTISTDNNNYPAYIFPSRKVSVDTFYTDFSEIIERKYEYTWVTEIFVYFDTIIQSGKKSVLRNRFSLTDIQDTLIEFFGKLSSYFPSRVTVHNILHKYSRTYEEHFYHMVNDPISDKTNQGFQTYSGWADNILRISGFDKGYMPKIGGKLDLFLPAPYMELSIIY